MPLPVGMCNPRSFNRRAICQHCHVLLSFIFTLLLSLLAFSGDDNNGPSLPTILKDLRYDDDDHHA